MKFKTKVILSIVIFLALERFTYMQTGGFSPYKICYKEGPQTSYRPQVSAPLPTNTHDELLNQTFYYLGKGAQYFVFLGEDGKTILKFVKYKHAASYKLMNSLFESPAKEDKRVLKLFKSAEIAGGLLGNETGIIDVNLVSDRKEKRPLKIVDKLGIEHIIDLSKTSFILQNRATPLFDQFTYWQKEGKMDEAKAGIDSLLAIIQKRHELGIRNMDTRIRNFGFTGTQAIEIDIGSFIQEKGQSLEHSLKFETKELKEWLDQNNQKLSAYLTQRIDEIFSEKKI